MSDILYTEDVAQMLRVRADTVKAWRAKGTGPRCARVGKRVIYRVEDVDQWLAAKFDGAAPSSTKAGG